MLRLTAATAATPWKPFVRSVSYVSVTRHRKPQLGLAGLRLGSASPAVTPVGLSFVFPHTLHVPPYRLASSSSVGGDDWYSSIADSAPVHLAEQAFVNVQQMTGLPWWLSIMFTTLTLRTLVTLPLAAYQIAIIAKVEALQAEIAEMAKRLRYEVSVRGKERGWTEKHCRYQFNKNMRRIISQLYIRDNCHPFKASLLVWVQLPMWISLSMALRNLSLDQSHTVLQAELALGGALWFSDLTLPDSTWILPVCLGLTNLLIIEMLTLEKVEVSRFQKILTNVMRGISLLLIPITAAMPSSMALYWFSSSLVGLGHNLLLRSPGVRRVCGLPAQRSNSPYRDMVAAFIAKYFK